MKKRTAKRALSTAMALMLSAGTVGAYPIVNIYAQDGINVLSEDTYNEIINSNNKYTEKYNQDIYDTNDYNQQYNDNTIENLPSVQADNSYNYEFETGQSSEVNEKYATMLGKYDEVAGYKDGMVLFSNLTDTSNSYGDGSCFGMEYEMNSETTITFVDKNGTNKVISNKTEDGTAKYDAIRSISPEQTGLTIYNNKQPLEYTIFKYMVAKKNDKYALIDKNTNLVKLGESLWYDDIIAYKSYDGDPYYVLVNTTGEKVYEYTLINEKGDIIFKKENCWDIETFQDFGVGSNVSMFAFLGFEGVDGTLTVIDFSGKVWYDGVSMNEYYGVVNYEPWVILQFSNEDKYTYKYCNYSTGKVVEGNGIHGVWDAYQQYIDIYNGDTVEIYDTNMNFIATLPKDKKFDVQVFDETIIISTDDDKIVYYNGTLKDWKEIENVSDSAFYTLGKTEQDITGRTYYASNEAGIIMKYTTTDLKDYYVFVSRESGYTKAELLSGNVIRRKDSFYLYYNKLYYMFENADKNIQLDTGEEKNCKYKLVAMYKVENGKLQSYSYSDKAIYNDNLGNFYAEDGTLRYISLNDGTVCTNKDDAISAIKVTEKVFGDTGYSYSNIEVAEYGKDYFSNYKFNLYDNNGNKIQTISDTNENIDYVRLSEDYSNIGYFSFTYREKDNKNFQTILYAYDGEKVVSGDENSKEYNSENNTYHIKIGVNYYYNKNANMGIIVLPDKRVALLKNFGKEIEYNQTITDIVSDTNYKIDTLAGVDGPVLSGIATGTTVNDIKQQLGNENIQICDKKGNVLDTSLPVGTGSQVQLLKDGQVIDTAVVVVKGDTDGTGTINILDMEAMQKSILGINKLTGVYKTAAILNEGEQNISVLDMETVQKDILGIKKII